ncbi:MAG: cytochrome c [Hydrocarboniphaga sp.]|uniref:c-type cytochrome n=1 Tax=Hydrocarboniphaga sp. TaxID=2033016 RepID=UPI0026137382|nr:cytochrome c [Hydrocarboniphaga sp.]MDB5970928.1 cytochrome c [Hydrocarboniphaga sp.]
MTRIFVRRCALLLAISLPAPAVMADPGAEMFATQCSGCHQADGSGVEGMYPPLTGLSAWAATPAGREYLAQVLTHGLFGTIEVGGASYMGGLMPGFAHLKIEEIVDLLNFVTGTLNQPAKNYTPFDAALVEAARAAKLSGPAMKPVRDKLPKR